MSLDASRGLKVPAKEVIGMRAQQQPATRIRVIVDPSSLYFLHFKLLSTTSCARLFNLSSNHSTMALR
ncbi:hypothetical protein BHE90_010375 [Fusarium euwallaceae]|uniref:Uncharacterized protein n=1 Tax=Fusarium euwallaceae TaxID=1147111 RepID=A0A430LHG9_9HYPO|nr:hypothetical protein BHE90_010375 [Fusarium euwallaceae]